MTNSVGTTNALPIDALGGGAGGPLPLPSPWTNYGQYTGYRNGGVVVGVPTGLNEGVGTINVQNGIFLNGQSISSLFIPVGTPFVVQITSPAPTTPAPSSGQLYWDSVSQQLYIYQSGTWTLSNSCTVTSPAPTNPAPLVGRMYWDSVQGSLYVYDGATWHLAMSPINAGTF